jgi:hypothetical protein
MVSQGGGRMMHAKKSAGLGVASRILADSSGVPKRAMLRPGQPTFHVLISTAPCKRRQGMMESRSASSHITSRYATPSHLMHAKEASGCVPPRLRYSDDGLSGRGLEVPLELPAGLRSHTISSGLPPRIVSGMCMLGVARSDSIGPRPAGVHGLCTATPCYRHHGITSAGSDDGLSGRGRGSYGRCMARPAPANPARAQFTDRSRSRCRCVKWAPRGLCRGYGPPIPPETPRARLATGTTARQAWE